MRMIGRLNGIVMGTLGIGIMVTAISLVSPAGAADAGKGKEIYAKSCGGCHGPEGKGDGAAAKAMNPKPTNLADKAVMSKLDDAALANIIVKGGVGTGKSPLMPAFSQLKDQDVKDVVAYLRTLSK